MKLIKDRIALLLILISAICFSACNVAEDDSDCLESMEITFRFMKNGQDRFGVEVSSIDLFVFDEHGYFVGKWSENDNSKFATGTYSMVVPLPSGTYNCVAWGGLKNNHYALFDQDQSLTNASNPIVGETNIADMLLEVRDGSKAREVDYTPTNLFFGDKLNVDLNKRQQGSKTSVVIDLVKNSKQVDLKITGLPLPTKANKFTNIDIWLASANGGYTFRNEYETPDRTVEYTPVSEDADVNNVYYGTMHTFRMTFGRPIVLTVRNNEKSEDIVVADILEEYIRKTAQYSTQAAVDAEDYFLIELVLDPYMSVSVKINGWNVNASEEHL